jgi:sialic acid synthase SpsE/quercetin dioxygenase-like cupin family protein
METRLSEKEFKDLKDEMKKLGFLSICTPFDENSVSLIEKHNFDIIKIASCSFTDWPLLERIAETDKPVITSTAGASLEEIDKVVSFLEHRGKKFCLMHCVGAYPTKKENMQLNQIDLLRTRYQDVPVGFSTHEEPDNFDTIKQAVAKGANVFEKHVGVKTDKYDINAYSATPEQAYKWLESAKEAFETCGVTDSRHKSSEKELSDLRGLKRGVFAKKDINKGEKISKDKIFFAIPNTGEQILANDMSKYMEFTADKNIKAMSPVLKHDIIIKNLREKVLQIINSVSQILKESSITVSNKMELELSHHYGIESFNKWGAAIINCINREYCKKLIILLPEQKHPVHHHKKKEETFNVLYGDVTIALDGKEKEYRAGDMIIVQRGVKHSFSSKSGGIFEEISTTHYKDDSFYEDAKILENKNRKTEMTFWSEWLYKPIS